MTDWTNAEIMRRVEDLVRRFDTVAATLETGYVRKDAHDASMRSVEAMHLAGIALIEKGMEADRRAAERAAAENAQDIKDVRVESRRDIEGLKADRKSDLAWKRQITATLIGSMIGLAGVFGIAVFNLLTGG